MRDFKSFRRIAAAVAVAAIAAAMVVSVAGAQSPPNPPSRFVGNILVDGAPATAGTLVEARIGAVTCGSTTVFMSGGEARYVLDSPASDPAQNPNCGTDGSTVTFYVAGKLAAQTGSWANYRLNTVNLTVTTTAATTPTAAPTAAPSRTPSAPVAGNTGSESSTGVSLLELMLVAAALGLAGVGVAATVRKD